MDSCEIVDELVDGLIQWCVLEDEAVGAQHFFLSEDQQEAPCFPAEFDGDSCAICLDAIPLEDTAVVKGCGHVYCACCILTWATFHKDAPRCPQCKNHFNYLYLYKNLDGSLCDCLLEESVTLLLRARWFQGKTRVALEEDERDDDDAHDDEEDEYLFPRGRRVVLSNRRWGGNGFVSSGHRRARAVQPPARPSDASSGAAVGSSSGARVSSKKLQREAKKQEKADKEAGKRAKRAAARAGAGTSRCLGGRASDNSDVPQEHAEEILLPAA
mmetsp:Transcript_19929/g.38013  ORF Transcript_19929/g.38013 Transcript_19929/m.38013 type:complete len:271 (-) Transcript_19929:328-1140(-)|eukprot:CAMPEP_0114247030 /NCGR_PEP_ID=MMETSP0058-20121206/12797_1 /TAXON_ID=36894 /ORGANISM="Pyramimonas parkeae, CCMP726" /LENGTH=270 /DNA_ID=CAMNT_0001360293 /DNA_START=336 /DNA_END=1148 /DNA_ORIENTATION=+